MHFTKTAAGYSRCMSGNFYDGKNDASYPTQGLLGEELKRTVSEIKYAAGMDFATQPGTGASFESAGKTGKMPGFFAGADFFKMFSFPLLEGTAAAAISEPHSIAISRSMAEFFFGNEKEAIGKTIRFENRDDLKITAVFENLPANSSEHFDYLRSWTDYVQENDWVHNWGNTSPSTFVQLKDGVDASLLGDRIKNFIDGYRKPEKAFRVEIALQPYPGKYLNSHFKNGYPDGGRIEYVRLFTIVAIFYFTHRLHQFYEPGHGPISKTRQGSGA